MDRQMDRRMEKGQTDEPIGSRQTNKCSKVQVDGWMERQTER
jgi:hypothetical protein